MFPPPARRSSPPLASIRRLRSRVDIAPVLQPAVTDKEVDWAIARQAIQNEITTTVEMNAAALGSSRETLRAVERQPSLVDTEHATVSKVKRFQIERSAVVNFMAVETDRISVNGQVTGRPVPPVVPPHRSPPSPL